MSTNTHRFTTSAGIALAVLAGAAMWTMLVGVTMWAVTV